MNGQHNICSDCRTTLSKTDDHRCPICRIPGGFIPNPTLGRIVYQQQIGCSHNGCTYRTFPSKMADHEKECEYDKVMCPCCHAKLPEPTTECLHDHWRIHCRSDQAPVYWTESIWKDSGSFYRHEKHRILWVEEQEQWVVDQEKPSSIVVYRVHTIYNTKYYQQQQQDGRLVKLLLTDDKQMYQHHYVHPIPMCHFAMETKKWVPTTVVLPLGLTWTRLRWSAEQFWSQGDMLIANDTQNKWYHAVVLEKKKDPSSSDESQVLIHFNGWSARWDEWMPISSVRLQLSVFTKQVVINRIIQPVAIPSRIEQSNS